MRFWIAGQVLCSPEPSPIPCHLHIACTFTNNPWGSGALARLLNTRTHSAAHTDFTFMFTFLFLFLQTQVFQQAIYEASFLLLLNVCLYTCLFVYVCVPTYMPQCPCGGQKTFGNWWFSYRVGSGDPTQIANQAWWQVSVPTELSLWTIPMFSHTGSSHILH